MINKFFGKKRPAITSDIVDPTNTNRFMESVIANLFVGAPYVRKGIWSFCNHELDLVYPELTLFSETLQKEIVAGVVIHYVDLRDETTIKHLTEKCEMFNIVLVLVHDCFNTDWDRLKENIFSAIEKRLFSLSNRIENDSTI